MIHDEVQVWHPCWAPGRAEQGQGIIGIMYAAMVVIVMGGKVLCIVDKEVCEDWVWRESKEKLGRTKREEGRNEQKMRGKKIKLFFNYFFYKKFRNYLMTILVTNLVTKFSN